MDIIINKSDWFRLKLNTQYNFWDFNFLPKCRMGEKIFFIEDDIKVAESICSAPAKAICRCKLGNMKYRLYWKTDDFKDLR